MQLPEVRALIYYRLRTSGPPHRLLARFARRLWPPMASLELNCPDIGAGLLIAHGYGSVLWAQKIGRDCMIHQGVTLGNRNGLLPTIGDRVTIWPNAIVIGPVTIGDDAVVGAHALVRTDVAAGALAIGVPYRPPASHTNARG